MIVKLKSLKEVRLRASLMYIALRLVVFHKILSLSAFYAHEIVGILYNHLFNKGFSL